MYLIGQLNKGRYIPTRILKTEDGKLQTKPIKLQIKNKTLKQRGIKYKSKTKFQTTNKKRFDNGFETKRTSYRSMTNKIQIKIKQTNIKINKNQNRPTKHATFNSENVFLISFLINRIKM